MNNENQFRHLDTVPESNPEQNKPEKPPRNVWGYVLTALITATLTFILTAGVAIAVVSFAGNANLISFGSSNSTLSFVDPDDPANKAALDKLQRIYELVDGEFVDDLTDAELIDAMARGLLAELDNPYTFYLSAEQNQLIKESFAGNYSGIGAMVAINRDGQAEVTELTAGGPAIEAGVKLGDIFLEVDGKPMTEIKDVTELAALVRGEEGTEVEIRFYRTSTKETLDLSIVRRPIISTTVVARMLEDGIGYIQIREFSTGVSGKFLTAVKELQNKGATQLVIDLRNNGGGLANEVLEMLDQMLPEVEITRFVGRRNGEPSTDIKMSDADSIVPADMRYAILINNMTASASELMAGSLRDHGLARLIGEQSYGKGSGTITVELNDGSAVQLTNFLYYLPKGDNIEEKGLTPDEIVSLPEEARSEPLALLDPADDTQLQAAISWLRSLMSARPAA